MPLTIPRCKICIILQVGGLDHLCAGCLSRVPFILLDKFVQQILRPCIKRVWYFTINNTANHFAKNLLKYVLRMPRKYKLETNRESKTPEEISHAI